MEVGECGGAPMYGGGWQEVGAPNPRKHISDFEELIKDIDDAIHNEPVFSNSKSAGTEITVNHQDNSCNQIYIVVMEDDPIHCNQIPNSNEYLKISSPGAKNFVVEFKLGWVDSCIDKGSSKGRPNKSSNKGVAKTKAQIWASNAERKIN